MANVAGSQALTMAKLPTARNQRFSNSYTLFQANLNQSCVLLCCCTHRQKEDIAWKSSKELVNR